MATLVIDTHNFITRLKEAGMEEKQAEAILVRYAIRNFTTAANTAI